ncbi:hypothetical protein [Pectobacterium jejuense]|uniref:hypothetical protein n=1 Tax=Pectobacterium jejuense TaxID=2974022 RepID=UPI0022829786|nr:hypothetical protein [Pectobacterium jejuense]MCY9849094.1 hypothetical protein [Pectobacterium jejuense]
MINSDMISKFLNTGLNILTFYHPVRTAIGYVVAALAWCATGAYPGIILALGMESNNYSKSTISLVGFIVIQAKTVFDGLTGRGVNEEVQAIINTIDKSPMTQAQKRIQYVALINSQIEKYSKRTQSNSEDKNVPE